MQNIKDYLERMRDHEYAIRDMTIRVKDDRKFQKSIIRIKLLDEILNYIAAIQTQTDLPTNNEFAKDHAVEVHNK